MLTNIKIYAAPFFLQVVVDFVGKANGVVFEDTRSRGKPIVFFFRSRPFTGGMCEGVEQVLATMKAGGKRKIVGGINWNNISRAYDLP